MKQDQKLRDAFFKLVHRRVLVKYFILRNYTAILIYELKKIEKQNKKNKKNGLNRT